MASIVGLNGILIIVMLSYVMLCYDVDWLAQSFVMLSYSADSWFLLKDIFMHFGFTL